MTCFAIYMNLNLLFLGKSLLRFIKKISLAIFYVCSIQIFINATTPVSHLICIGIYQIICFSIVKPQPHWLSLLLILLANDVDNHRNYLSFMNWNLNSLTKNNFERVHLLQAHNVNFSYDIISVCESNLTDITTPQVPKLDGYEFVSANHPGNVARGGVCAFYKDDLPVICRRDLSFDECLVLELKFGRKKVFFTVLYRSPAFKHSTPEFDQFIQNFRNLYHKINSENPFAMFFTGDFNAHSQFWWSDGNTNLEGSDIEDLFTSLNLTQLISEPTNFEPGKNLSCIDLIVTDQPNIILDSGTRASLDSTCHHQITYGKVNFRIPPPPPSERKIWHYQRADITAIQRSMNSFPWFQHLSLNNDINWQVKTFSEIILNIISNFIPNEVKCLFPETPPGLTNS